MDSKSINRQKEKMKKLAEEMVEREFNKEGYQPKDDHSFYKIRLSKSVKHKSQIFVNRNKKTMLNYFALNRGSSIESRRYRKKDSSKSKRRSQSTMEKQKIKLRCSVTKSVMGTSKTIAHRVSFLTNDNNTEIKRIDCPTKSESFLSVFNDNDNYDNYTYRPERSDITKEENEKEEDKVVDIKDIKDITIDSNYIEDDDDENYNYIVDKETFSKKIVIPKKIKKVHKNRHKEKRDSPSINNKINNNIINNKVILIKKEHKHKARYFFDKEMKLLRMRNNKIEKKRQNLEKKKEDFYKKTSFLNLSSEEIVRKNPNHRPIYQKSIEEWRYHLAKIKIIQKINEEKKKKEIEQFKKSLKSKKRRHKGFNWEEYIEKKKLRMKEETRRANKLLDEKIRSEMKDRPQIDKKSKIIVEKLNRNNSSIYLDDYNDIHTRLYKQKEIYENKLEMKRLLSMPTFRPKIYKSKNKRSKSFLDSSYKDNVSSTKETKNNNNRSRNVYTFALDSRNKNLTSMRSNRSQISLKYNKKAIKSGIKLYRNRAQNDIFLTTKNVSDNKRNKEISITLEYNISKSNFDKINTNRTNNDYKTKYNKKYFDNDGIINPVSLLGIDENKLNKICLKKNKNKNKNKDGDDNPNLLKNNGKNIVNDKKKMNNRKVYINEELNNAIKNLYSTKKEPNIRNKTQSFLYDLNIRENTSNTLRENIVLTTNKYSDFFKKK